MANPTVYLKNQFGEQSANYINGGSDRLKVSFTVAAADVGGAGVTGVIGASKVFMHTSQTPATGSPNPLAGYIMIQLPNNYIGFNGFKYRFKSPLSGSSINITSGVTAGQAYVITALGTSTQANWAAIGLPVGIVPAVNVAFIASVTGNGVGTGTVQVPLAAAESVYLIDDFGTESLNAAPTDLSGAWLYFRVLGPTSTTSTVLKALAPTDGTVITLDISMTAVVPEP